MAFTVWVLAGVPSSQAQPQQSPYINRGAVSPAVRIDVSEAPIVDGDLSDPVWAKAVVIDEFYQQQPNAGQPVTERTELRILYDENNLYFGVYNYDSMPEQILGGAMQRDGNIASGDAIRIILDPGPTRRNGYAFAVSPAGGRQDALFLNNNTNLNEWNTLWTARTRIVEDGWIAEIAIPFRNLSYDPAQPDWGLEFQRSIRHKNETVRWSNFTPNARPPDIAQSGTLTGISGTTQGVGLDVQIYGVGTYAYD